MPRKKSTKVNWKKQPLKETEETLEIICLKINVLTSVSASIWKRLATSKMYSHLVCLVRNVKTFFFLQKESDIDQKLRSI